LKRVRLPFAVTLRRYLLAVVAVALLHAQSLGLLHRLAHQPHANQAAVTAARDAGQLSSVASPFAHEAGEADCRLFDGLLASGPGGEPIANALSPAGTTTPAFHAAAAPRPATCSPFEARGPPLHS